MSDYEGYGETLEELTAAVESLEAEVGILRRERAAAEAREKTLREAAWNYRNAVCRGDAEAVDDAESALVDALAALNQEPA